MLRRIENLGDKYEVVDVAPGYARNYLFSKNWARVADEKNLEELEEERKSWQQEKTKKKKEIKKLVEKLEGEKIKISKKTNEEGKLFGSVGEKEIKKALEKKGLKAQEGKLEIEEPIKDLGEWDIRISFPYELEATVKLLVEEEE